MCALRILPLALLLGGGPAAAPAAAWQQESWRAYVEKFVQQDGRVIDFAVPPGVTTSEGQAYALLRAVWMDDRPVFERVLAWTNGNLARPGSPLPAWRWGALEAGGWGILDVQTASDADVILALALDAAAQRWGVPDYEGQARAVAAAVWSEEVESIAGRWYLLPGAWAKRYDPVPLNLSYYKPAFLRRLARLAPDHPWEALAATTYALLEVRLPTTDLPPDWLSVSRASGALTSGGIDGSLSGQFGHDAYRVYWNLAVDYVWDRSEPAKRYLAGQAWLAHYLELNGTLPREVSPRALPRIGGPEPLALYGALYPALLLFHRDAATQARAQLDAAYKDGIWGARADYYAQNIVWFGMALGEGRFPPFAPR
jgi:endoglucanase